MSSLLANNFLEQLLKKVIDFDVDTFKIILMGSGYVFNRATHTNYSEVNASELPTAHGYTAGGNTLGGVVVSQDDVNNCGKVVWNPTNWMATGNLTASGAIIFENGTGIIVGYIDFGGDQTSLSGGVATIDAPTVMISGSAT